MNSTLFALFFVTSLTTILSPGPGVLMTIMKSIQYGYRGAIWTIFGTSFGTVVMAAISGTGIGLVLAHSPIAYGFLRVVGAFYLIWLGVKSWRARPALANLDHIESRLQYKEQIAVKKFTAFLEGISLQMTNPVLIMFFIALFPQFIDPKLPYAEQYALLTVVYFFLVFSIHSGYSLITTKFRGFLKNPKVSQWIYCMGGTLFLLLAAAVLVDVTKTVILG